MSEADFLKQMSGESDRHSCKLDAYREFVVNELTEYPFLSCAQIEDHLKEHFDDLPEVSEKTVYNFVMRIREEEDIPKENEKVRQTAKVPECEYGEMAQVDYGEKNIYDAYGHRVKVYFFAILLCRSRYRFVYLQSVPFTAASTVYAHHLAFQFFGGVPEKILYDQDKKMLTHENFGDYLMTEEFSKYVTEVGFAPVFAMPADPQTKGKVENLVRYVKENFLCGRKYLNDQSMNEQAAGWLDRTANAKVHGTTHRIPAEVFEEERKHLRPYNVDVEAPSTEAKAYTVRKDNTITYHGNTYALPLGTYDGRGTRVYVTVNHETNELEIYDSDSKHVISHTISTLRGMHVTKEGLSARVNHNALEAEHILRTHLGQWKDSSPLTLFLQALRTDRPRYYSKSIMKMASLLTDYDKDTACALLDIYIEDKVYNAARMEEIAKDLCNRLENAKSKAILVNMPAFTQRDMEPEKRGISEYAAYFEEGGGK